MTEIVSQRRPFGGALSAGQAANLVESGAFTSDELAETEASVRRGELAETARLGAIVDSLSEAHIAVRLGVGVARVHELQGGGELHRFIERRYPLWQFTDGVEQSRVPHLSTITNAFPSDMRHVSV